MNFNLIGCLGDWDNVIVTIEVWDYDQSGQHDLIGK